MMGPNSQYSLLHFSDSGMGVYLVHHMGSGGLYSALERRLVGGINWGHRVLVISTKGNSRKCHAS